MMGPQEIAALADAMGSDLGFRTAKAAHQDLTELGAVIGAHVGPGTIAVTLSPCSPGARTDGE